jgi:hypothetical protein
MVDIEAKSQKLKAQGPKKGSRIQGVKGSRGRQFWVLGFEFWVNGGA